MHILLLPSWYPKNPSDVGGVFFRDQALALDKQGHRVGVVAPMMKSLRGLFKKSVKPDPVFFEDDEGVTTYRMQNYAFLPRVPYGNYWIFKRTAKKLIRQYIKEQGVPDIIHAHSAIYGGAVAAELARELNIPLVITEHSTGFARGLYAPWQLSLAEGAFLAASSCIAVSPELAKLISEQMPATQTQWQWVPNVVADRFNKKQPTGEQRPLRFLNLALMTEKKGQFDLLHAFKKVREQEMDVELWLGGDGPIRAQLEQIAKALGNDHAVRFLGMVEPDKVPGLLVQVDVMVVSSHYETFGVVAAEALTAGVPVVATRCGGPECIVEEGDGVLVEVRNPDSLASGMLDLAQNIHHYQLEDLSNRALARFSGEAVAKQLTQIYADLLS